MEDTGGEGGQAMSASGGSKEADLRNQVTQQI